jgi:hypothetical protein
MIHRLHGRDLVEQFRVMAGQVLHQFELGVGRARHQRRVNSRNCLPDGMQVGLIFRQVTGIDGIRLVMQMRSVALRPNHTGRRCVGVEADYPRLCVVDPDDCMGMGSHGLILSCV